MGPPLPSTKPPPHGTKHCQRKMPPVFGVRKLNVTTECGEFPSSAVAPTHGPAAHRALFSATVGGEATGTFTPRPGIANVCCTEQSAHESNVETEVTGPYVFPLYIETFSAFFWPVLVNTPATWPQSGLRSGVQPS